MQRNTREENTKIKGGEVPEDWEAKPNKLRQKDVEARWTRKGVKNYYGYKNQHIGGSADKIHCQMVCDSSEPALTVRCLLKCLSEDEQGNRQVWADSAYRSEAAIQELRALGYKPRIQS